MTSVVVPLPEHVEQQLRQRATERGVPLEEFARELLEREAAPSPTKRTPEEWVAEWRAWASSRPKWDIVIDDSRESIYEGCGE